MREARFWALIDALNWRHSGKDENVIEPVVRSLAMASVREIKGFEEHLAYNLFRLDTKDHARRLTKRASGEPSADGFLGEMPTSARRVTTSTTTPDAVRELLECQCLESLKAVPAHLDGRKHDETRERKSSESQAADTENPQANRPADRQRLERVPDLGIRKRRGGCRGSGRNAGPAGRRRRSYAKGSGRLR